MLIIYYIHSYYINNPLRLSILFSQNSVYFRKNKRKSPAQNRRFEFTYSVVETLVCAIRVFIESISLWTYHCVRCATLFYYGYFYLRSSLMLFIGLYLRPRFFLKVPRDVRNHTFSYLLSLYFSLRPGNPLPTRWLPIICASVFPLFYF